VAGFGDCIEAVGEVLGSDGFGVEAEVFEEGGFSE
jgi:hypothetical protein